MHINIKYLFVFLSIYLIMVAGSCDTNDFEPKTYSSRITINNKSGTNMSVGVVFTNVSDVESVSSSPTFTLSTLTNNGSTNIGNTDPISEDGRGYGGMVLKYSNASFDVDTGTMIFKTTSIRPNFDHVVTFQSNSVSKDF